MHKQKTWFFLLFVLFGLNQVWAQTDTTGIDDDTEEFAKPEPEPDTKYGIKMGMVSTSLFGSENKNNTLAFGILGGGYVRQKLNRNNWVQAEVQVTFRGSKFKASTSEISAIRLLYVDVPVLYLHSFSDPNHRYIVGMQGSYLVAPTMYILGQSVPLGGTLKLNQYDILPVVGYQYHMPFFALQFAAKYGLININNGADWPQGALPPNKGKTFHNFVLEFNLIF